MTYPIDLSMLTREEQAQFDEDMSTLYDGDVDTCLYLRYSSEKQTEQSIEGQLRDCRSYCKEQHYRIRAVYVDRATTASRDVEKRFFFQKMISDSAKRHWEAVVVWKLDRFARNRTDSALYKYRLRRNGVRVISATERITDQPEGIILEAVLEGMAEFYSADLSQKVTRGLRESAMKGFNVGGHIPLGYKIVDHRLVVDPLTAPLVKEAFELYAAGESVADICRLFNSRGAKTAKGAAFNRNSFKTMFRNERYIGVYTYKDLRMEGKVPAIVSKELFNAVGHRLDQNAKAPARGKAKVDYLLSGKLFCGHCGAPMHGDSGTSKTGTVHNYYACYNRKRHKTCDKRPLRKELIERWVVEDAMTMLTDDVIEEMADMAIAQTEQDLREHTRIPALTARKKEIETGVANITKAIEKGIASDALMDRLMELEADLKQVEKDLAEESQDVCQLDRDQVIFWLSKFQKGDINDEKFQRQLIDLLVNSVTVWDEPDGFRITTAYNLTSHKSKTFRVSSDGSVFGLGGVSCTIRRESEPCLYLAGLVFTQTRKHPLP